MIKGVWTALPNLAYFGSDDETLNVIVKRLYAAGIQGMLALGTTGQGPDKSLPQRMSEVERLLQHSSPERLVIGVTANAVDDVRTLIAHAASCGVRGVAITTPYYGAFAEDELQMWIERVLRDSSTELEYYMYNIPGAMHHRWTRLSLETASNYVTVSGIKDSSGDLSQLIDYLDYARQRSFSLLVGDERFGLYNMLMGGDGFISGFSSAYPHLMCKLYDACVSRNIDEAAQLQQEVNEKVSELLQHRGRKMVGVLVQWMRDNGIVPTENEFDNNQKGRYTV